MFLRESYDHSSNFDFRSYAKRFRKKGSGSLRLAPTGRTIVWHALLELYQPRKEEVMNSCLLIAALAILGFLCFSGPDGFIGTKYRH